MRVIREPSRQLAGMRLIWVAAAIGLPIGAMAYYSPLGSFAQPAWLLPLLMGVSAAACGVLAVVAFGRTTGNPMVDKAVSDMRRLGGDYWVATHFTVVGLDHARFDLAIMGPHGILLADVVQHHTEIYVAGDSWSEIHSGESVPVLPSPIIEARRKLVAVKEFLDSRECQATAAAIVLIGDRVKSELAAPSLPVVRVRELSSYVKSLPEGGDWRAVERAIAA